MITEIKLIQISMTKVTSIYVSSGSSCRAAISFRSALVTNSTDFFPLRSNRHNKITIKLDYLWLHLINFNCLVPRSTRIGDKRWNTRFRKYNHKNLRCTRFRTLVATWLSSQQFHFINSSTQFLKVNNRFLWMCHAFIALPGATIDFFPVAYYCGHTGMLPQRLTTIHVSLKKANETSTQSRFTSLSLKRKKLLCLGRSTQ